MKVEVDLTETVLSTFVNMTTFGGYSRLYLNDTAPMDFSNDSRLP